MSLNDSSSFSGEDWRRNRFSAIPEAPPASSSFSSSNSISGGTKENSANNDKLINSSSRRNSAKEKISNHVSGTEQPTKPSPPERKSAPKNEKISKEVNDSEKKKENDVMDMEQVPKKINPRLVHLDFIEKSVSNIQEVRSVIVNHTQIRNFTIKILPKGGISVLLGNKVARNLVEDLLYQKLEGKVRRKGFLANKKLFEVSCRVPKDMEIKKIMESINAVKFIKRGGNEFIFFLSSQDSASDFIKNGRFIYPYHLEFAPFTFAPRIMCKGCGSSEHQRCSKELCNTCGHEHKTEECSSEIICLYCKGSHTVKDCLQFKEKSASAKASKKKSYAEALTKSTHKVAGRSILKNRKDVSHQQTSEIISVYCEVAGIPFKEHLLEQVKKKLSPHHSHENQSSSLQDPVIVSPEREEPKKKSSKTKNKEYATAVINSYEKSSNPPATVRPKSPLLEMKGVEGNVKAFCSCGIEYNTNPGWKNHFYNAKGADHSVTCPCGKFILTPKNWNTTYGPMKAHLKKECKGSQQ